MIGSPGNFLKLIGVPDLPPATSPFDPGYDQVTLEGHLAQSGHLMSRLKLSMACWLIADEDAVHRKIATARRCGVPIVTGGAPLGLAVAAGRLPAYVELCQHLGVTRIECGAGFTDVELDPLEVVTLARERGLEVQFELGKKSGGAFGRDTVDALIDEGWRWLDAGAAQLVIEARESAQGVGLFDAEGRLNRGFADRFGVAFGLEAVAFEAPTKPSQFALLDHFGRDVQLCNVRLEELLRVEIYRRGLHADAFDKDRLRLPGVEVPAVDLVGYATAASAAYSRVPLAPLSRAFRVRAAGDGARRAGRVGAPGSHSRSRRCRRNVVTAHCKRGATNFPPASPAPNR